MKISSMAGAKGDSIAKNLKENNTLPFLDTLIHRADKNINISVYRKPTHTGLSTKWNSYVPIQFKQNLIKTLLNKSHNICNTYLNKHKKIQYTRTFDSLVRIGYAKSFINKNIKQLLIKFQSQNNCNPQSNVFDQISKIVYIKLPYVREISNQLSKDINSFFRKFDTNMQLRLMHTTCKLKKLFPYKDKQPHLQQFNVMHQLKCDCGALYIGQTGRNLITRLSNHNIDSSFWQETDVSKHQVDNLNHKIDFNKCAIFI